MFDEGRAPAGGRAHDHARRRHIAVREARKKPLTADGASQIRLYKQLAALLAPGFGYGRLTSNQAIGVAPEEATIADAFRQPAFMLTPARSAARCRSVPRQRLAREAPQPARGLSVSPAPQDLHRGLRRQYKQHEGGYEARLVLLVICWRGTATGEPTRGLRRGAMEAIRGTDPAALANTRKYIQIVERNKCQAPEMTLRVGCMVEAAAQNCKQLPCGKRDECGARPT